MPSRDKGKSKRELPRGWSAGESEDPAALAPFPAQWKRVSLSSGRASDLEPGDCELIDELRRKVCRSSPCASSRTDCTARRNQLTLGQPQLEVEALTRAQAGSRPPKRRSSQSLAVGTEPGLHGTKTGGSAIEADRATFAPQTQPVSMPARRRHRDSRAPTSDRRRCADRASVAARGTTAASPAGRSTLPLNFSSRRPSARQKRSRVRQFVMKRSRATPRRSSRPAIGLSPYMCVKSSRQLALVAQRLLEFARARCAVCRSHCGGSPAWTIVSRAWGS